MFFSACNAVRRIFFESAFMQAKTKKVRRKVSLRRTLVILLRRLLFDKLPAVAYVHVALFGIGYFKPRKIVTSALSGFCLTVFTVVTSESDHVSSFFGAVDVESVFSVGNRRL